jgi:hypothetical protein
MISADLHDIKISCDQEDPCSITEYETATKIPKFGELIHEEAKKLGV